MSGGFFSLSTQQIEVVIYALYGGSTVDGFAYGGPCGGHYHITPRSRKSALELIRRTGKALGIERRFGGDILEEIRHQGIYALLPSSVACHV